MHTSALSACIYILTYSLITAFTAFTGIRKEGCSLLCDYGRCTYKDGVPQRPGGVCSRRFRTGHSIVTPPSGLNLHSAM